MLSEFKSRHIIKLALLLLFLGTGEYILAQCTKPVASDTSRCGPGTLEMTATGATGFLYWYTGSSSFDLAGYGSVFTTPALTATDTFFVAEYDTNTTNDALRFDGANDYVAIDRYNYNGADSLLTVEVWVRTTVGTDQILVTYDRSEYWRLEINGDGGGTGQVGFDVSTNLGIHDFGGTIRIDDGNWHHIAAVFDNGTSRLYIDGVLDNSASMGSTFGTGLTRYGFLGVGSEASTYNGTTGPNSYFNGSMDEVRIWNIARTQAEIVSDMQACLTGNEPGLVSYFRMDGTGSDSAMVNYSLNGNHGNLQNMTLPGAWISSGSPLAGCPVCVSARDSAVATVHVVPQPDLGNDTCVNASIVLDAGSYNSYIWNTGETSQMILADSSGTYSVEVDSIGSPCVGNDAVDVALLMEPSGNDTSRCGSGSTELTVSGSTGSYYWYDTPFSDSIIGTGSIITSPTVTGTDTFYVAAYDNDSTDAAILFDGIDDYVGLNMFYNASGQINTLTVEAWVRTTISGAGENNNWAIVDFDRSEYYNLYIHGDDGRVGFSTTDNSGSIVDMYAPLANAVNDGNWHHIAAVYNGTDKIIFIDGTQVATQSNPHNGRPLGTGVTRFGIMGDGSEAAVFNGTRNNFYYSGEVDELRIWSDVRNLLEIQGNMNFCLSGSEQGLQAYYKMDDGSGSSTLTDHSRNGRDGTLFNMHLTTSWSANGPEVGCSCGESLRDTVIVTVHPVPNIDLGPDTCVSDSLVLDAGAGYSSYLWQNGSTSQQLTALTSRAYNVTVDSIGTPCAGSDQVIISVGISAAPSLIDSARCGSGSVDLVASGPGVKKWWDASSGGSLLGLGDTLTIGPITSDSVFYVSATLANENALDMDGSNDFIALSNYTYSASNYPEFTIEAWIRTSSGADQVIASFDRSEYWRLEINGTAAGTGQVGLGIRTNVTNIDLSGSVRVDDGNWHHVAGVYDNGFIGIYVDGILDASTTSGNVMGTGLLRYGFIGVGSEAGTFNGTKGPSTYFNGDIDEIRIWSVARTGVELSTYMDSCLSGTEPGLDVYYRLSEGGGTNANDVANGNDGLISGATWIATGQPFNCSVCGESERVPVQATIHADIDSSNWEVSCPGASGTIAYLRTYGGSGSFDYRDITGIFNYNGIYESGEVTELLPNGGIFDLEIMDENNCLDTLQDVATSPSPAGIATANSTDSCRIPNDNNWYYVVNASNRIILGIRSNGADLGQVRASGYFLPTAMSFAGEAYLGRHYLVSADNTPVPNADVRFFFTNAQYLSLVDSAAATSYPDDDVSSKGDLGVTKYNGPTEDSIYDPADNTSLVFIPQIANGNLLGQSYIDVTVPSFSEFWIHANSNSYPLPVTITSFLVNLENGLVRIEWTTEAEINCDYFEVQKSVNGVDFELVNRQKGGGNSRLSRSYLAIDEDPWNGVSYYRLKQVDFDGTTWYSELRSVVVDEGSSGVGMILYPNPTSNILHVYFNGIENESELRFEIADLQGKMLLERPLTNPEIKRKTLILETGLTPGLYIFRLQHADGSLTSRFIVQ